MEEKVILRTYSKTWHFERKIYAIDRIRLLVPVAVNDALYFVLGLLITLALLKIFPVLNGIPAVIRYGLIPYGLMKFLTKKKFDGKMPHMFLIAYLSYLVTPKIIARYQSVKEYKRGRFCTPVIYRSKKVIDITSSLLEKSKKSKKRKGGAAA